MKEYNATQWLLGGIFAVISLTALLGIVYVSSQADTATTSATISNANPEVESVFVSSAANGGTDDFASGVTLNAGTTKSVHVNGVIRDNNGTADIASASMVAFRSGATGGSSCTADNNDCYTVTCTLTANDSLRKNFNCEVPLQYFADPTDSGSFSAQFWDGYLTALDASSGSVTGLLSGASKSFEVNSLLSLNIPTTIPYGSRTVGEESSPANNIPFVLTNRGNVAADIQASGGAMSCTTGSIPVGNQQYNDDDAGYDGAGNVVLTGTATNFTDLDLPQQTVDATAVTDTMYWDIKIPTSGVAGTCSGTNTITAIAA